MKLKDIYTTNRKYGDPQSAVVTLKQNEDKINNLNLQLKKYLDLYQEVEINGGISKTTATLSKQKTFTLGRDNNNSKTMMRSTSQGSINSNNNNNNNNNESVPGTPISQHGLQNTSITSKTQVQSTPIKSNNNNGNGNKYSENESFDDENEDETDHLDSSRVTTTTPVAQNGNSNYDVAHPKLQRLNLNQTKQYSINDSTYEPIDSPPLSGNPVTSVNFYRHDSKEILEVENEVVIGKALVVYEFKGTVQNAISIIENETLNVLEKDSGDGWTLVKRNNGEKGYVPTDYVRIEYF